jgi:hypothetical protein
VRRSAAGMRAVCRGFFVDLWFDWLGPEIGLPHLPNGFQEHSVCDLIRVAVGHQLLPVWQFCLRLMRLHT